MIRPDGEFTMKEYYNWLSNEVENIVAKSELTEHDKTILLSNVIRSLAYLYGLEDIRQMKDEQKCKCGRKTRDLVVCMYCQRYVEQCDCKPILLEVRE